MKNLNGLYAADILPCYYGNDVVILNHSHNSTIDADCFDTSDFRHWLMYRGRTYETERGLSAYSLTLNEYGELSLIGGESIEWSE